MPEQLLSDFRAPKINGVAAERVLSNELLKNIFQGDVERNGRGVTQTFTSDTSGAEIRVLRVLPIHQDARELGARINGGGFNDQAPGELATAEVGIRILQVIDAPIDIPDVTQDMIRVDLLKGAVDNLGGLVTRNLNAVKIAAKVVKTLGDSCPTITFDPTDKETVKHSFTSAANKLDLGDPDFDIDVYPEEGRIYNIRPEFKQTLLDAALFSIGDLAQHMFAQGQMSPGDTPDKVGSGFIGQVMGIPAHMTAITAWNLAARYCGLPVGEFATIVGYCASHVTNSVGVAVDSLIKVDPHPYGRGVRLKPLIRLGAETWYGSGNSFITTSEFSNPFTFLKTLDSAYTPILRGPGSRQFAKTEITVAGNKVSAADKEVYVGAKHFYAFTKDGSIPATVQGFKKAYEAAGATKGTSWTNGVEITPPTAAGSYYLITLTLASDGTVCVAKSSTPITKA